MGKGDDKKKGGKEGNKDAPKADVKAPEAAKGDDKKKDAQKKK